MQELATGKFHFEPPCPFTSFDHLVGGCEHARWNYQAERAAGVVAYFTRCHIDTIEPPAEAAPLAIVSSSPEIE
jgi:hypothetical protein